MALSPTHGLHAVEWMERGGGGRVILAHAKRVSKRLTDCKLYVERGEGVEVGHVPFDV